MLPDHHKHDIIFVLIIKFLLEEENDYRLKPIPYVQQVNEDPITIKSQDDYSIYLINEKKRLLVVSIVVSNEYYFVLNYPIFLVINRILLLILDYAIIIANIEFD
jgi:hypothetical protein